MATEHKPIVLIDGKLSQLPNNEYISGKEDDVPQLEKVDFVGDDLIYRGWSPPGSATTDPVWKIARFTFTGADDDLTKEWADSGDYTQIWDNRASLTYA